MRKMPCLGVAKRNLKVDLRAMSHFDFFGTILRSATMGNPSMERMYVESAMFCAERKASISIKLARFGIGFKSVYAFTTKPEIHSGDEHFVIEKFIRPREVRPRELDNADQTLFYFPFDHATFRPEDAFHLIQTKLSSIGARSLLFLNHVKALIWTIEDAGQGCYMRETHPSDRGGSRVQIIGERTNQQDTEEEWLVLQRDVPHPTRTEVLPVKLAYSVVERDGDGESVQPVSPSPLTVYFPTARQTGLSFLIHGPFASTPARDNIESDCDWNDVLLSELASLVADSLEVCKEPRLSRRELSLTLTHRRRHVSH